MSIESAGPRSALEGPSVYPGFATALDDLIATAKRGHSPDSTFFNPDDDWLVSRMRVFQDLPGEERQQQLAEWDQIRREAAESNAKGRAASRAGPEAVFRLNSGGLAFYSQFGVARRPDLTQYFIDGFRRNRDGLAFSETNQRLFAEILPYITSYMKGCFSRGDTIVQSDRRLCDAPGRSYHVRQLLCGTRFLQVPFVWRQLAFDLPLSERQKEPDILEVSLPTWLDDLDLPDSLRMRVATAGLTQLIFKAPTRGLSLHLGFDYVGEHKMGPLSVAMFMVKQRGGMALQAALSVARVRTAAGETTKTALVTAGPSLHGKSTLTIMIELARSELAEALGLPTDVAEGVYPMNDDIILIQPVSSSSGGPGSGVNPAYGIDGTEDNFYAVPAGLTQEDDPITYEVLRGTPESPNENETLENVVVDPEIGVPDFQQNPTRNMRMVLSRGRLIERKGARQVLESITGEAMRDSVHVPMDDVDRVFWQAVMRLNTVVPPLRRMRLRQYIRVLMYGEAVQMGAATGAIGKPYVEYFSDPFIIGLEDENANALYRVLKAMEEGGQRQEYYVFNTGGVGADTNDAATGALYKKIPRDLTLMLQEALLRDAVKFEREPVLGSDLAAAVVTADGREIVDLRENWWPSNIYGEEEYRRRVVQLRRHRYYGSENGDRAGVLRYTKALNELFDLPDIPLPSNERELAWLLSFYWSIDEAQDSVPEVVDHLAEGEPPAPELAGDLRRICEKLVRDGMHLQWETKAGLAVLGLA